MTETKYGWFTKGDYVLTYKYIGHLHRRHFLLMRIDKRIHEKHKKRIVYEVEIIWSAVRSYDWGKELELATDRHPLGISKIRRDKDRGNKRVFYKLDAEDIERHVLMETI